MKRMAGQPKIQAVMGIAWYRREDWGELLRVSKDPEHLEEKYEDWLATAEKTLEEMRAAGTRVEQVEVEVVAMVAWCAGQKVEVDARSRARYVSEKLREKFKQR